MDSLELAEVALHEDFASNGLPVPGTSPTFRSLFVSVFRPAPFSLRARRIVLGGSLLCVIFPLCLVNRIALWLDEVLFPGIRRTRIERPLFIVGPPRSGTTFLHRLVAADDEQFTTTQLWELLFAPAVCQKWCFHFVGAVDRRLGGWLKGFVRFIERRMTSSLNAVHDSSLFLPEEDYFGLQPWNACFLLVIASPDCAAIWRLGHFDEQICADQRRRLLRKYRGVLQRHLYFYGRGRRLLSKNPSFSSWVRSLAAEFPDARFVAPIRCPHECVPSQLSSIRKSLQMFGYDIFEPKLRDNFINLMRFYYENVTQHVPALGADTNGGRGLLVDYKRLCGQPAETLNSILSELGYDVTASTAAAMEAGTRQARQFRSRHKYTLEEFGLCVEDLNREFGEFIDSDDLAEAESDAKDSSENERSRDSISSGSAATLDVLGAST